MKYGICHLSVIPCREEQSDKSEMISQLLFGEHYKIIEERAKWVRVRNAYDKYEGWIDRKQSLEISEETYKKLDETKHPVCVADFISLLNYNDRSCLPVVLGSTLPSFKENKCIAGATEYAYRGDVSDPGKPDRKVLIEFAKMYENAPYLWGGRSPFGIDCSGYTQVLYKLIGIKLPRDASEQSEIGRTMSFVEEAEEGDLAFFDDEEGNIIHVGVVMQNNYIIHASGKVRIDRIDHQGIYNVDAHKYSHKLRLIKQVIK